MEKRKVSEQAFKAFEKTNHYKQALIQAEKEIERDHLSGKFSDGNPNHPMYNNNYNYAAKEYVLFGYKEKEFLNRQYN